MIDYKLKIKEVINEVSVNSFVETTEDINFTSSILINNRRSLFCKQKTECMKNFPGEYFEHNITTNILLHGPK